MRLSLRLIALLVGGITLVVVVAAWSELRAEEFALRVELEQRAEIVADRLRDAVEPALRARTTKPLETAIDRLVVRHQLGGAAVYDMSGQPVAVSAAISAATGGRPDVPRDCKAAPQGCGEFLSLAGRPFYAYTVPVQGDIKSAGLTVFLDASAMAGTPGRIWRNAVLFVVPQVFLIAVITYFVMQSAVLAPIARTARWMRDLRFGRAALRGDPGPGRLLDSISSEAESLAQSLMSAQQSAEAEARLREAGDSLWTAERLRVGMQARLHGSRLIVVSNREPYEHVHRGRRIETLVPPSGVVTALEPVLRACDGTWVAHASGDADSEVVDARCRVRVPPDDGRYTLRRVWLTPQEVEGYYFGFANEGLWPLCHIAYARPVFRVGDWEHYQRANEKFADAVLDEMRDVEHPVVLVQDYHFALVPRLIKSVRPDARVAMFWHIPWPNPEAFEVCPWQQALLDGMLGADLIGFHIQAHCTTFSRRSTAAWNAASTGSGPPSGGVSGPRWCRRIRSASRFPTVARTNPTRRSPRAGTRARGSASPRRIFSVSASIASTTPRESSSVLPASSGSSTSIRSTADALRSSRSARRAARTSSGIRTW